MDVGPHDVGLGRRHIVQMIDESLQRLSTDYVDLYKVSLFLYPFSILFG